jgi:hypothetical protein
MFKTKKNKYACWSIKCNISQTHKIGGWGGGAVDRAGNMSCLAEITLTCCRSFCTFLWPLFTIGLSAVMTHLSIIPSNGCIKTHTGTLSSA